MTNPTIKLPSLADLIAFVGDDWNSPRARAAATQHSDLLRPTVEVLESLARHYLKLATLAVQARSFGDVAGVEVGYLHLCVGPDGTDAMSYANRIVDLALTLAPDSFESNYYKGIIYRLNNDSEAALEAFRKASRCEGMFILAHWQMACLLVKLGRHEEALAAYKMSLAPAFNPVGAPLDTMGQLMYQSGDVVAAMELFDRTLDSDYRNLQHFMPPSRRHFGMSVPVNAVSPLISITEEPLPANPRLIGVPANIYVWKGRYYAVPAAMQNPLPTEFIERHAFSPRLGFLEKLGTPLMRIYLLRAISARIAPGIERRYLMGMTKSAGSLAALIAGQFDGGLYRDDLGGFRSRGLRYRVYQYGDNHFACPDGLGSPTLADLLPEMGHSLGWRRRIDTILDRLSFLSAIYRPLLAILAPRTLQRWHRRRVVRAPDLPALMARFGYETSEMEQ